MNKINYPLDSAELLRNRKKIRELLLSSPKSFIRKRIAILGGSTTAEFKEMLDLFLLNIGIQGEFYESEYARYDEEIRYLEKKLIAFKPDIIYFFTSNLNIKNFPKASTTELDYQELLKAELTQITSLWKIVKDHFNCIIIQNNYELPFTRVFGNLDNYHPFGKSKFINELNLELGKLAQENKYVFINDINWLSSWMGLEKWHDRNLWFSYKYAFSFPAIIQIAKSASSIIAAIVGLSKKCLVLDLDNTLWGGVIGDDGVDGIILGAETPDGEAYRDFQKYILELKERGIILAICSKNEVENAKLGLAHPDCLIKESDIAAMRSNWSPKHENIRDLASELNIDISALVFVDDNPAEREIVASQEPLVCVPNIGDDVSNFVKYLDQASYFEPSGFSNEDVLRNQMYKNNSERSNLAAKFDSYDDFLKSLEMAAEIHRFDSANLDRITQLINKTNQFNLTTKRFTFEEVRALAKSDKHISIYGKLRDKFGDNGLISIVSGEIFGNILEIDLWLMSCRVLKRGMEDAMMEQLIEMARASNISVIKGVFIPSAKNQMVKDFYEERGFKQSVHSHNEKFSLWELRVDEYKKLNLNIRINK